MFAHALAAGTAKDEHRALGGVGEAANREELIGMMTHFEDELDRAGFFFPPEKRDVVQTNLRNMFTRAGWTKNEVQAFRGAIKALALGRGKARIKRED